MMCAELSFLKRSLEFSQNRNSAAYNENASPIYDLLNTNVDVGLYDTVIKMITQGHLYSKEQWKKIVWESIWQKEDYDCNMVYKEVRDPPMSFTIPYIWLFWLCEILALLGQNGGKEIMAHINFGSPRV